MVSKQNPFGSDGPAPEAIFEAMKRMARQEATFEQAKRAALERERGRLRRAMEQQAQNQLVRTGLAPLPEGGYQLAVRDQLAQIEENTRRQKRLAVAMARGADGTARDREAEAARLALGRALSDAVAAGLLSEDRAVAMIVAGGINNQPMTPDDARAQVTAALAQAVASGAMTREQAVVSDPGRPSVAPPSQGAARPQALPPDDQGDDAALRALAVASAPESGGVVAEQDLAALVRAVPELLDRLDRLEGLLYEALTIRPCHDAEHVSRHRDDARPCDRQAGVALGVLLDRLDLPPTAVPRAPHRDPDGRRAACCARDGNLGTWLVYGRTLDPQATFSRSRPTRTEPS